MNGAVEIALTIFDITVKIGFQNLLLCSWLEEGLNRLSFVILRNVLFYPARK